MSQLLAQIKRDQLTARKSRSAVDAAALTTLIGDVEAQAKRTGELGDKEVVALVKKYIANANFVLEKAGEYKDVDLAEKCRTELGIYERYIPRQMKEDELHKAIQRTIQKIAANAEPGRTALNIGTITKALKADYEGQYDGALAARLIKEALGG